MWKCASCRKQFSVLTGTIFHGTKVALADWLTVMVLMCSAKNGIAAREVETFMTLARRSLLTATMSGAASFAMARGLSAEGSAGQQHGLLLLGGERRASAGGALAVGFVGVGLAAEQAGKQAKEDGIFHGQIFLW